MLPLLLLAASGWNVLGVCAAVSAVVGVVRLGGETVEVLQRVRETEKKFRAGTPPEPPPPTEKPK
jgi:hypothetical protein